MNLCRIASFICHPLVYTCPLSNLSLSLSLYLSFSRSLALSLSFSRSPLSLKVDSLLMEMTQDELVELKKELSKLEFTETAGFSNLKSVLNMLSKRED